MAQLPPGFVLDSAPATGGPVYGAPPKAPPPPTPLQIRDQQLQEEEHNWKSEDRNKPNLPAGYMLGPDGKTAVRIPGLPEEKTTAADEKGDMRRANLDSIVGQINRVQELYDSGIRDETFWNGFGALDSVGPSAGQFDAAGQAIADQGLAAFRVPGIGAQSDMEARQFALANTPQSGNWDSAIEEKLRTMRARVDANRKALGLPPAQWAGTDQQSNVPPSGTVPLAGGAGGVPPSSGLSGGGDGLERPTGDTRRVPTNDPVATQVDGMIRQGAPFSQINAFMQQQGRPPISARQYAEWRQFLKRHPDYQGGITRGYTEEPVTTMEKVATTIGDNPIGTYAINAGQFLSGNTLDNLSSDPERARQGVDFVSANNPNAAVAGQVTGGIMAGLTGEAGLARLGMASGLARGTLADIAAGAANGAGGADNGNRMEGAAQGGVAAGLGSLLGAGATRAVGKVVSPTGGRLSDLYEAGVRPTPGQRFADTGVAGRTLNAAEEALQSVPVVGSAIRGARQEARDQFQIGAFNQALAEIGETLPRGMKPGTDPHRFTQEAFGRIYDRAREGMKMVADEELSNDLSQLAPDIQTLGPQMQNRLKAILANAVNSKIVDGGLSGKAYKNAVSDLGVHIARFRKGMTSDDQAAADVLEGVQRSLDASARRHSEPDAIALLDAADAGYAKLVRIEEAAARRGGETGTFSPAGFDSSVQKASGGIRSKAYLRGDANMQDYAAAGRSLEDRMPNSGTPERAAVGTLAAGGAAYLEPTTLAVLGTIGGAYAPGIRKVTTGAIAPGGPKSKAIAAQLRKRARLVGAAGASSAVAALPGTAPGQ